MFKINIKKFNPLSDSGRQELVGIDFSGNTLKLAHVRDSLNKRELVGIRSHDIRGLADDAISKTIRVSFDDLKARNPNILNVLPAHLVITKNIEIPSLDEKEIKEIIALQASRHTPYAREEIIVDYIDIGTYKQSYTKILLVIVARNVIKRQFEILDRAGLKLERVCLAPESLAGSIFRISRFSTEDAPAGVVHIDESFSDFSVVFRNKVVFIRSIPLGAQHLTTEKEIAQPRFVEEVKRSLEAYQNEDIDKTPNMLVLTGAIENLNDLETLLNNNLPLNAKLTSFLKDLAISDQALEAASLARNLSFLNVIAPLLTWEKIKVNLIPEEIRLKKLLEERGRDLIKTGIFILTIFVLIFSILLTKIYFKGIYLKNLDKKYHSLKQEAQKLEEDFAKVNLIKKYLSGRGYSLEILTELYNLAALDLELNDIRYDEQGRFSLRGAAESMSAVFNFVDKMEKSKYFKDAKTKYTAKRKDGLKDVTDFEITSLLEPGD